MDEPEGFTGREHDELDLEPAAIVRNRRPRALWAVLAAVALAAGALVVTSSDDDGNQVPGLPVDLAFGSTGAGRAEAAADAMLAWVTYVAGDDLPALGGEGTAYRLAGDVDEARVRALAEALGVAGDVQRTEGAWFVIGEDGLTRLDVHFGGGTYWSYYRGGDCVAEDGGIVGCYGDCTVDSGGVERCAKPAVGIDAEAQSEPPCSPEDCAQATTTTYGPDCPEDGAANEVILCSTDPDTGSDCVDDDCIAPDVAPGKPAPDVEPAEPVTPPDDVARVALDVVAASGHDVEDAIVTALPFEGGDGQETWYVTVEPRLDGIPSGLLSSIEVSADLRILSGNGILGDVERLGDYPLLDTRAAIERANEQMGEGVTPGIASDMGSSGSAGVATEPGAAGGGDVGTEGTTGGTDGTVGGTDGSSGDDQPTATVVDPCSVPDGASDGCGGTTGCGGDGCVEPTTTIPCKVQADGSEICELSECPQTLPPVSDDVAVGAPTAVDCAPPPNPVPLPEPEPIEIVLVDAERSLVLLPANDGSGDAYLVPAYRFTVADDGGTVDLPAVAGEALTGPDTTETTEPDTVEPAPVPVPVPEPQPCEVLEEGDASGTTHTVPTCPTPNEDPRVLGEGEEPAIGVGYYVDVHVEHCSYVEFAGWFWGFVADGTADPVVDGWSQPTEGGTFTLRSETEADFVGDAAGTKVGRFTRTSQEGLACA